MKLALEKCSNFVRKLKNGSYQIYKNEKIGRSKGAKLCNGDLRLDWVLDYHYSSRHDMGDDYVAASSFDGFHVICSKCQDLKRHLDLSDIEALVSKALNENGL